MAIVFALKFLFRSTSNVGLLFKLKEGNWACQKRSNISVKTYNSRVIHCFLNFLHKHDW